VEGLQNEYNTNLKKQYDPGLFLNDYIFELLNKHAIEVYDLFAFNCITSELGNNTQVEDFKDCFLRVPYNFGKSIQELLQCSLPKKTKYTIDEYTYLPENAIIWINYINTTPASEAAHPDTEIDLGFLKGQYEKVMYNLYGVIDHSGNTYQSGHYVSYVKNDKGWQRYNDSLVSNTDPTEVRQLTRPVLLFYHKLEEN